MEGNGPFPMQQIYDAAYALASGLVHDRTMQAAVVFGLALFIAGTALLWYLGLQKRTGLVVAVIIAFAGFSLGRGNLDQKMADIGHELANTAVTQGVDVARDAQSTYLQYIHAPIIKYGTDVLSCNFTANRDVTSRQAPDDKCLKETGWYTYQDTNHWTERVKHESCSKDSDGNEDCTTYYTYVEHWDDEYTPFFSYVELYWVEPDTKTKYLHAGVYQMVDDNGKPKVYYAGWRAPQNPAQNTYNGRAFDPGWQFNGRVPEFWSRVQNAIQNSGPLVVGSYVGQYFNWALASESTQFAVYDGQYKMLQQLAPLPGPTGVAINYTDAFGKPATMRTLLSSADGELPQDFTAVSTIGFSYTTGVMSELNARALEFQGDFGPTKQSSARWFLVADSVVAQLGGLRNTTTALKAYLNDPVVWGNFALPKNQVILVASVSDDGSRITGRDMETGLPFGNVLVEQYMRLSIPAGNGLPVQLVNVFGNFTDNYVPISGTEAKPQFSDLTQAGGVIGVLYAVTPNYVAPDPNSQDCVNAPADNIGYSRYRMCALQYLKSTIQIHGEGARMIMASVQNEANNRTPVLLSWILLVLSVVFAVASAYASSNSSSNRYR